jgi:hypothetical protein
VSVRPGFLLETTLGDDLLADLLEKRSFSSMVKPEALHSVTTRSEVAAALADAVSLDESWNGKIIDVAWDRAVCQEQVCEMLTQALPGETPFACETMVRDLIVPVIVFFAGPGPSVHSFFAWVFSGFKQKQRTPTFTDVVGFCRFVDTGKAIADTTNAAKAFGKVTTPEEGIKRFLSERCLLPGQEADKEKRDAKLKAEKEAKDKADADKAAALVAE